MRETDDDLVELQRLLDQSIARSGEHLRSIITPGKRTLTAHQLAAALNAFRPDTIVPAEVTGSS